MMPEPRPMDERQLSAILQHVHNGKHLTSCPICAQAVQQLVVEVRRQQTLLRRYQIAMGPHLNRLDDARWCTPDAPALYGLPPDDLAFRRTS